MNTVYMKVFPEPRPTRTTVGIAKLVGTARMSLGAHSEGQVFSGYLAGAAAMCAAVWVG